MKYLYILPAFILLFGASLQGQNYYTFRYNPYSDMNKDQLDLALKQAQKMEQSGKIWTAVGTGMMVGGAILTFDGINQLSLEEYDNWGSFAGGLGVMCLSAIPLGYGLVAWLMGSERANMIEIELLSSDLETLSFKPTEHGVGLVLTF